MPSPVRSILAATDLGAGSDAIVTSAARVAARTGAELHLIHSLELPLRPSEEAPGKTGLHARIEDAEERLEQQVERTVPEGVSVVSQRVIAYIAHKAILHQAQVVSADLVVLGPHRGGAVGAHFLGTTADRVIRTADVPCLVVTEPLKERVGRVGVPLDFSDPSQGALEVAFGWALEVFRDGPEAAGGVPEVRVMHVDWPAEVVDDPDREERLIRPALLRQVERARSRVPGADALDVETDVLRAEGATNGALRWVEEREVDLLVMGTHGAGGVKRALIGSTGGSVARQAPCPVLLVPPSLWSGRRYEPRLERVVVGADFSGPAMEAARWSMGVLAPEVEHVLVHVVDLPEPPALLAGRFGPREELRRTVRTGAEERLRELVAALEERGAGEKGALREEIREGRPADEIVDVAEALDADLIVLGGQGAGNRGAWTPLGTTAERVLRSSPTPVLVVRGEEPASPEALLVPVDGSTASLRALHWGHFLSRRFGTDMATLYVESPALYEYSDTTPSSTDPSVAGDGSGGEKADWVLEREKWLREQVRRAGIDPEEVSIQVAIGRPADEILAARERSGAGLIVMGTRGRSAVGRFFVGSVAGGVLRGAACPVLVVGGKGMD